MFGRRHPLRYATCVLRATAVLSALMLAGLAFYMLIAAKPETALLTKPMAVAVRADDPAGTTGGPNASESTPRPSCRVWAVLAHRDGGGSQRVPPDLEPLRATLEDESLSSYGSFSLLEVQRFPIALDSGSRHAFETGHDVTMTLLGSEDHRLQLQLEVLRSDSGLPMLQTNYRIEHDGTMFVALGRHGSSDASPRLFFAFRCHDPSALDDPA